jgi:hypothetical protein
VGADPRTGKPDPSQTLKLGLGFKDLVKEGPPTEWKKAKADAGVDAKKETGPTTPVLSPDESPSAADAGPQDAGKDTGKKGPK